MTRTVLYHNPSCSKSRGAKEILEQRDVRFEVVEYLKQPLDKQRLVEIMAMIEEPPTELVRRDKNFERLDLDMADYGTAEAVADLLVRHPELMQRPILVKDGKAVIARPSEKVESLL